MSIPALPSKHDEGVTLPELLVVLIMMVFVLASSWAGFQAVTAGTTASASAVTVEHDMSDPLELTSKMVMQNNGINTTTRPTGFTTVSPTPYQLWVWTNRSKSSATAELDAFYADPAGELVWERWSYNSSKTAYTQHVRWVMSSNNANISQHVPLFMYLDANGAPITDMTLVPSAARSVRMTAVSLLSNGRYATDSRSILFRNKN